MVDHDRRRLHGGAAHRLRDRECVPSCRKLACRAFRSSGKSSRRRPGRRSTAGRRSSPAIETKRPTGRGLRSGLGQTSWTFSKSDARGQDGEFYAALDERLGAVRSEELTFAEWFTRWDSGPRPLVVDRLALDAAGLGPRSLCAPGRGAAEPGGLSRATLKRNGLALVSKAGVLVITTAGDRPRFDGDDRWAAPLGETLIWGADRGNRFQSVARWRGEPSPRLAPQTGDQTGSQPKFPPGWSTWRFSGSGWPGDLGYIHLIDVRRRVVAGWIIVGLCILAWAGWRRLAVRRLLLAVIAVMAGCLVAGQVLPARFASFTAAGFLGGLSVLIAELAQRLRRFARARRGTRSASSLWRRAGRAAISAISSGALALCVAASPGSAQAQPRSVILALFPYEGVYDPAVPLKEVVLRLSDYNQLKRGLKPKLRPSRRLCGRSFAVHRVRRAGARSAAVESELELEAVGTGPFAWRMPVARRRNRGKSRWRADRGGRRGRSGDGYHCDFDGRGIIVCTCGARRSSRIETECWSWTCRSTRCPVRAWWWRQTMTVRPASRCRGAEPRSSPAARWLAFLAPSIVSR